ncbi:neuronal pentraxin-1-like [Rana temporaria]|uniref:neuronal pentraxin-1-like n=1 Tax=Rana temporaria TaxID=8407 RepID=UPI001AAD4D02|nr:neuronal pentraxin-1-like [Rana temporaria]
MKLFSLFLTVFTLLLHICWSEYSLPKFVCTPMPLDMDCQSNVQRHSSGGGGHWVGMQEEAKETILHLRETVVHQKETILDQRETIRELTVKLSRCEGYPHSRVHEEGPGHSAEHGQEREHGHEEGLGHESSLVHESGHGHEREHGHKREHGHEWEEGQEREHGHELEHHEREHGHKREHGHEWEERHERDYGHERDHGYEREHGHEREHPHGHEDIHGHNRDHEYHHLTHREYREQPSHDSYRKPSAPPNTMEDPPEVTPPGIPQMERMLESLKDRLEHLQGSRNSSLFSTSLRDTLQKKISILEHQIFEKHNSSEHQNKEHDQTHEDLARHKMDAAINSKEKGHKSDKKSNEFRVSFPLRTNYMYAKVKRTLHHEIFAFTICLWLKSNSSPGVGTPFSYSVPGQANEVVLIEWGNNPMELLINDKAATLPLAINDAKWHHVCVTWSTRDGVWESYLDGVRRGNGENLAAWHPIKPGGVFVLGQEQDTLGGRFDATQAFVGEISDFNMWSHILTPGEIYKLATCAAHSTGDVIEWTESSMELHGGVTKLPFNSCH